MGQTNIRALVISADPSLAKETEQYTGGPRVRAIEYSRHMQELVYLVLTMKSDETKQMSVNNLVIHPTDSRNRLDQFITAYRIGCRLIETHKLNIVDAQEPWYSGVIAYLLAKKYHLPLCIGLYGDDIDNPVWLSDSLRNRVFNIIGKYIIKRSCSLHVSSMKIKERMRDLGINETRLHVLPVYVEASRFNNVEKEKGFFGNNFSGPVVLSVGRLDRLKNIQMIIRAAKIVNAERDVRFAIVGSGPEKDSLIQLSQDLKVQDRVLFLGSLDFNDMPRVFKSSDIFVLPSNLEGRSLAVVEAMLSGLPIILTDISGARDVVSEGYNGYLITMNDHELLAKRINQLLEDTDKRLLMGKRSRELALKAQSLSENAVKMSEYYAKSMR